MNAKRLKYICYYDTPDSVEERGIVYAATTKLDYIFNALNRAGINVDIVSFASLAGPKFRFSCGSYTKVGNNTLRKFPSCAGPKLLSYIGRKLMACCFIIWFLTHVKRGEIVAVYHSTGYAGMLTWLKRLTKCRYIGEIEEIYQDVTAHMSAKLRKQEMDFINCCDQYIFPTELLNDKINKHHKPVVIVYGVYGVEPLIKEKFDDGFIHVVYGGTFDVNKGGGTRAAAAAAFLPGNFHIHICGFGNKKDTENIKKVIKETNRISEAIVTFDGLKKGREYIEFIQQCHIGLSTQNPAAAFNDTSFPSKILVYLGNGLKVVTVDIPAIRNSKIGSELTYYQEQTSQAISAAIINAANKLFDKNRIVPSVLKKLDREFVTELRRLLY